MLEVDEVPIHARELGFMKALVEDDCVGDFELDDSTNTLCRGHSLELVYEPVIILTQALGTCLTDTEGSRLFPRTCL